jgi:isoaspartyl peptidase/L-asparaginase-like protein (Ntn-hydrolase superfamily)
VLEGVRLGWSRLAAGGSAVEAAVAATAALEDEPIFNAGTGSALRLDGTTVQMDAAVMDHRGRFGAVAAIERVRNPVLVACELLDSPHLLLAGEGATRFARALGVPDYDPATPESRERYRQRVESIRRGRVPEPWQAFDWRRAWNFAAEIPEALRPRDTVGAVTRDGNGGFACGASSGGFGLMLGGRVGDVPILGAGCFAGTRGAVCATGDGEEIVRASVCRRVYEWIEKGDPVAVSVERGLDLLPEGSNLGLLALGRDEAVAGARTSMAWAAIVDGDAIRADRTGEATSLPRS